MNVGIQVEAISPNAARESNPGNRIKALRVCAFLPVWNGAVTSHCLMIEALAVCVPFSIAC